MWKYNNRMAFNVPQHHRRSIRVPGYDYTQPGVYFITLCTYQRECLYGEIVDGVVRLTTAGQIVQACWQNIPQYFPLTELDVFVVMPNHFHALVQIIDRGQCRGEASPQSPGLPGSIGDA